MRELLPICAIVTSLLSLPLSSIAEEVFEVRGVAINSIIYDGKVDKSKGGDEVVYIVDVPAKTIRRTAVYNANIKDNELGGVQADDTVYTIVHDAPLALANGQRVIKGFGRAGIIDGYELLVIGEEFITTARSTREYFVLYRYRRTDPLAKESGGKTGTGTN